MIEIKHRFTGAILKIVDADTLSGSNLSGSDLRDSDLSGSDLRDSDLSGSNLRGSNLPPAPMVERLHGKILEAIETGAGQLEMRDWHTCETTHCRAGWAIHLAGAPGYALEKQVGPSVAGALIHIASCPWMERVPDFTASNFDALDDIKRCAEREAAL
jgi:uncharacterized protein YjbI with pentapeptide repeats